jgi:hypothetical protein
VTNQLQVVDKQSFKILGVKSKANSDLVTMFIK